jgi:regulator of protease activity HflC (stomatin/prohibitin superfamily)
MGKLVFGAVLLLAALLIRVAAASVVQIQGVGGVRKPASNLMRLVSLGFAVVGVLVILGSMIAVIGPGTVGVKHAFGYVSDRPLLPGLRFVEPWSSVERFSTREEQFPESDTPEMMDALSSEQMGMQIDVALRWQIDPQRAPHLHRDRQRAADPLRRPERHPQRRARRDGAVLDQRHREAQPDRVRDGIRGRFGARHAAARWHRPVPHRQRDGVLPA